MIPRLSEKEAKQLKKDCALATPLEQAGILEPPLSDLEGRVLKFTNGLAEGEMIGLLYFLDEYERHTRGNGQGVLCPPGTERDLERLRQEKDIDFSSPEARSFFYMLFSGRLGDGKSDYEHALAQLARVRVLDMASPQTMTTPLVHDHRLEDGITAQVEGVEQYLTSYFHAIAPMLKPFLPMELKVKGIDEMDTISIRSYDLSITTLDRYPQRQIAYTARHFYPLANIADGEEKSQVAQPDFGSPYFLLEGKVHDKMGKALFGMTMPNPLMVRRAEYECGPLHVALSPHATARFYQFRRKRDIRTRKCWEYLFPRLQEHIEQSEFTRRFVNLRWNFNMSKGLFSLDTYHKVVDPHPYDGSTLQRLRYHWNDDGSLDIWAIRREKLQVDWDKVKAELQPLFAFYQYIPERYDLREYKPFWEQLHAYANLPAAINERLIATFRDNYIQPPVVNVAAKAKTAEEGLQALGDTIGKVREAGYLSDGTIPLLPSGKE